MADKIETADTTPATPGSLARSTSVAPAVPGFEVGERLGAGGFGEVYRARHVLMGRDVAIKVLHARHGGDLDAIARFLAEARAIGKLSHPGIVDIFDVGALPDGRHFIAMELIRGQTLRDVLKDRGRLPLDEALPILAAIAAAIDAAHAEGIAHRDLKPDNVFVVDGGVKLIDFGLAKLTGEEPVTQTGTVFGTPLYMSPEQCRGKAIDQRTDAYSFGVLAYHVLVGAPPWSGDALELALHHLNDEPEPPSKRQALDARVDRVVLALMAKDPAQRPSPLAPAIDAITGDAALPAKPRAPIRRAWIAAGFFAIAIAGATTLVTRDRSSSSAPPAGSACLSSSEKLAGAWDPIVRARGEARFAAPKLDDVAATWRVFAKELDRYTERWSAQWTAACAAPDRESDRLLYAQRLTCLDNALINLRGLTRSTAEIDAVEYADGDAGTPLLSPLEDCESTPVLRVQAPAPPADKRDEVERLVIDVQRARTQLRTIINARRPTEGRARPLARLAEVGAALEKLGASEAAIAWYWRAHMLGRWVDPANTDEVKRYTAELDQAVQKTLQVAKDLHNDHWLASARNLELRYALDLGNDAEIDRVLPLAVDAVERAGKPIRLRVDLLEARARIAARRKQLDRALADIAEVRPLRARLEFGDRRWHDNHRMELLQHAGRVSESIAISRELLDYQRSLWGDGHGMTFSTRQHLIAALLRAGDARGVLALVDANLTTRHATERERIELHVSGALAAHRLGNLELARGHLAKFVHVPGSVEFVVGALTTNLSSAVLWVTGELVPNLDRFPEFSRDYGWFGRAYAAFIVGDLVTMRSASRHVETHAALCWPALVIDALEGKPDVSRAKLAALAKIEPTSRLFALGLIELAARNWKAAEATFAEIRKSIGAQRNGDTVEADSFLGLARLEAGNATSAIEPLEEAIMIGAECCGGQYYTLPIAKLALARALWGTGGDKARARDLATQARDGFAELGPGRARDQQAAVRWLAEHPL